NDPDRIEIEHAVHPGEIDTIGDLHQARLGDTDIREIECVAPGHARIQRIDFVLVSVRKHRMPAGTTSVLRLRRATRKFPPARATRADRDGRKLRERLVRIAARVESILEHDEIGPRLVLDQRFAELECDESTITERNDIERADVITRALRRAENRRWKCGLPN